MNVVVVDDDDDDDAAPAAEVSVKAELLIDE